VLGTPVVLIEDPAGSASGINIIVRFNRRLLVSTTLRGPSPQEKQALIEALCGPVR
jgi:hypothetical protein